MPNITLAQGTGGGKDNGNREPITLTATETQALLDVATDAQHWMQRPELATAIDALEAADRRHMKRITGNEIRDLPRHDGHRGTNPHRHPWFQGKKKP